ncbi:MAG: sulfate ABC transporter permease subunit CysW [Planctomycetes bacterium]|nr:sulfate ABC transporter permease subunit CysW [Planctomycetota bacterium]
MSAQGSQRPSQSPIAEPAWVRRLLVGLTLVFLSLVVFVPLAAVFAEAFRKGPGAWWRAISDGETLSAVRLTLFVTASAVPLNVAFGLVAAWALGKFRFRGRGLLVALVDLPLSISPVVAGLVFVLLFGARGWFGPALREHGIQVIFATPGLVIATVFVTFPYVARELISHLEEQRTDAEQAALSLGATGWTTFWRVTLPSCKWALLYGVILCNARAMGEFGAVSVVSGHVRGETNTLPLQVEILYNEYDFVAAFAAASLLALLALVTLLAKTLLEAHEARTAARGSGSSGGAGRSPTAKELR